MVGCSVAVTAPQARNIMHAVYVQLVKLAHDILQY